VAGSDPRPDYDSRLEKTHRGNATMSVNSRKRRPCSGQGLRSMGWASPSGALLGEVIGAVRVGQRHRRHEHGGVQDYPIR